MQIRVLKRNIALDKNGCPYFTDKSYITTFVYQRVKVISFRTPTNDIHYCLFSPEGLLLFETDDLDKWTMSTHWWEGL